MRLLEHYQRLCQTLLNQKQEQPITIGKLSNLLSCTERNAKLVVRRLEQKGWIVWRPGKGR
ncbi:SgrR family transcriptional regulator [Virgibacillus senegalensis]|uniref:SgrR family transcriptional regulator n=1 Tax=Virgibacillus senegalensis TaxID=1499679 RepID=UPI00069E31E2